VKPRIVHPGTISIQYNYIRSTQVYTSMVILVIRNKKIRNREIDTVLFYPSQIYTDYSKQKLPI